MATNPETEQGQRGLIGEDAREALESLRVKIVAKRSRSLIDFVLLTVTMWCLLGSPMPFNFLGIVTLLLLVVRHE